MITEQPITQEYVDELRKALKQAEEARTHWFNENWRKNTRYENLTWKLGEVLTELLDGGMTLDQIAEATEIQRHYAYEQHPLFLAEAVAKLAK